MAQPLDLPLPEITAENFSRAWTRFGFVAKAKEWDETKQLAVLPTLLRGKLLDHFVELDAEVKMDLKKLHAALLRTTGHAEDPLSAAKAFVGRDQQPDEKVLILRRHSRNFFVKHTLTSQQLPRSSCRDFSLVSGLQ